MAYAKSTKVSVPQSKAEIERLVKNKYGATAFGVMENAGDASIAFRMNDRNILFRMALPEDQQEERSLWRAMLLTIKGKLESAERGIENFEDAFLANIVMPDGRTVSQTVVPEIAKNYEGHSAPLLLSY